MAQFIVQFIAEVKSFNTKPIRKNKTEGTLALVTESYSPGDDFKDLLNKNGKMVKVTVEEYEHEDEVNMEARSR